MTTPSPPPPPAADAPFSTLIRTTSQEQHLRAETSAFMSRLLDGRLGVDAYTRYTEQLWFVYAALETGADALARDPVAGPFLRPELRRRAELERDLAHLRGAGWRHAARPLPATGRYAARVAECAARWPGGYVAHHYTRYLGDLSGGQIIRDRAARAWGFAPRGDGVRFYVFERIPNPAAFKRAYRSLLDTLPVDGRERRRIVGECRYAFELNTEVFRELDEEFPEGG